MGFAALTGLAAQVKVYLNPAVPISGQTFAVLLAGAALGSKRGTASMLFYLVAGIVGLPVFAIGGAVPGASQGYLVGFVAAAWVVGYFTDRGWSRSPFKLVLAMFLGEIAIYAVGLPWLAFHLAPGLPALLAKDKGVLWGFVPFKPDSLSGLVMAWGLLPFIPGDAIKLLLAAFGVPLAWSGIRRLKGGGDGEGRLPAQFDR